MYRNSLIFVIGVVALVHCFGQIYGKELEAKVARAELPAGLSESTAVYDGIDNVYIFGG
jgi:hypothetical protein